MLPTISGLSNTLGTVLLGLGLKMILGGQPRLGFTVLVVGLLLMLPFWWPTIHNALGPVKLPVLSQVLGFAIVVILADVLCSVIFQSLAATRLKVEGRQLTHDLADFFAAQDKLAQDKLVAPPVNAAEAIQNYSREQREFGESFTPRIDKFCNELDDDIGLRAVPLQLTSICETSRETTVATWRFGQFQAFPEQLPTMWSVLWGTLRYVPFALVSFLVWLGSVVMRNNTLAETPMPAITKTRELF